jgi:putative transposase
VTIKRSSVGEVFICFSCLEEGEREERIENKSKSKKELELLRKENFQKRVVKIASMTSKIARGIDFGMKDFLVLNSGEKIRSPEFLRRSIVKMKKESRKFSKCVKGSNNWHRQRLVVARLHEKIASQRLDWARKTAHEICKGFGGQKGFIFVEDLNLNAMKKLWGRKVSDLAFGMLVRELEWISRKYGIIVLKTGRFEKTSGVCSESGLIKTDLKLEDRSWYCEACCVAHDRDIEASKVIRKAGLRLVDEIIRDSSVRPSTIVDGESRAA